MLARSTMTTGAQLRQPTRALQRLRSLQWAGWPEVGRWALIAGVVSAVLLSGVAALATHDRGHAADGLSSGLLVSHHGDGYVLFVLRRNLLVLGIHICACWIGAIIGRPFQPASDRLGRLAVFHRPVPPWMAQASLYYALVVTLLSVGLQATALGRELADISSATGLSPIHLLLLVLPHAVPELLAVFLPLGLFLLEAGRSRLDRLGLWSLQAGAIALPILVAAALVETYVTPARVIAASRHAALVRARSLHAENEGSVAVVNGVRRVVLPAGRMNPDLRPVQISGHRDED